MAVNDNDEINVPMTEVEVRRYIAKIAAAFGFGGGFLTAFVIFGRACLL